MNVERFDVETDIASGRLGLTDPLVCPVQRCNNIFAFVAELCTQHRYVAQERIDCHQGVK